MDSLTQALHDVSPFAAGFLIASVWQGVLLTAGLALCLRVFRGVSPALRMALWALALLLVLVLPLTSLVGRHAAASGRAELHFGQEWSVLLVAVWLLLSGWRGVQLVANATRLLRLAGRAVPAAVDAKIQALLTGPRLAILCVSAEVDRPSVAGFLKPRILLPPGLLETLSPVELEHVVLHEMEHLRRWDDWLNLLQQVSLVLLPLNPALLWLDRRLCRERELACDDGVLQATRARRAYAACLVKLAEDSLVRKGVALALSALGTRSRESELVGRVRRILAAPESKAGAGHGRFAMGAVLSAVFALAGLLARSPEIVRFDATPNVLAQSVPQNLPFQTQPGWGSAVPVRAAQEPSPGPVLTRADVRSAVRGSVAHRVRSVAFVRRRASLRAVEVKAELRYAQPAEHWTMTSSQRAISAPARLVVTEFEVSQPTYAAVPWRGGWLIVQL